MVKTRWIQLLWNDLEHRGRVDVHLDWCTVEHLVRLKKAWRLNEAINMVKATSAVFSIRQLMLAIKLVGNRHELRRPNLQNLFDSMFSGSSSKRFGSRIIPWVSCCGSTPNQRPCAVVDQQCLCLHHRLFQCNSFWSLIRPSLGRDYVQEAHLKEVFLTRLDERHRRLKETTKRILSHFEYQVLSYISWDRSLLSRPSH